MIQPKSARMYEKQKGGGNMSAAFLFYSNFQVKLLQYFTSST